MNGVNHTSLTGAAGEHLVMSRLLSRGFIAALAPQGVPNMDIVVTSPDGKTLCSIQVKSRWDKGADGGWHMSKKHEDIFDPRMFYCFVDLGRSPSSQEKVYVVPSLIVANVLKKTHEAWLKIPGRNGQPHNDNNMRRFRPDYSNVLGQNSSFGAGWLEQYHEAWETLIAPDHPAARMEEEA